MADYTSSDNIYKYIGLIAISLFVIFIIMRTINFQSKVLEGLTSDFNSGGPYVMFKGTGYDHVMVPLEGYYKYQPRQ